MERYDNRYTLGLDVGIASVGWSLIELDENNSSKRIIDLGVRIFEPGEDKSGESYNRNRREKRGIRRLIRRKRHRKDIDWIEPLNYLMNITLLILIKLLKILMNILITLRK